jgi:hypothetical protein
MVMTRLHRPRTSPPRRNGRSHGSAAHDRPLFSATSAIFSRKSFSVGLVQSPRVGGTLPPPLNQSDALLATRHSSVAASSWHSRHLDVPTLQRSDDPYTLLRPQPLIESAAYATKASTPPGVGVPAPLPVGIELGLATARSPRRVSALESTSCAIARTKCNGINILCKNIGGWVGWVGPSLDSRQSPLLAGLSIRPSKGHPFTTRPSGRPLTPVESHPCAIARTKSHRMTSLRKNQGVGGARLRSASLRRTAANPRYSLPAADSLHDRLPQL